MMPAEQNFHAASDWPPLLQSKENLKHINERERERENKHRNQTHAQDST